MSRRSRSTVLIVDQGQTRTLSVNTRLLNSLRPTILGLAAATGLLTAGVLVLGWQYIRGVQQNLALRQQVVDLQNHTSAEIAAKLQGLSQSERVVLQLQQYLKERGVNVKPVSIAPAAGQPNMAAGGPAGPVFEPVPFTGSFSQDTASLLQVAQSVPLGLPHSGPLSSGFGVRANPFSGAGAEDHGGLDFKGHYGEPIHSTANGRVIFAGVQNGYGNVVKLAHAYGYTTLYAHMSEIKVKVGQTIPAGTLVGTVGSTGRSTGPHLHYEVRKGDQLLDPIQFLSFNQQ